MANVVSNTSPLLYLYRIQALDLLPLLFDTISVPTAVITELDIGKQRGFDVPVPSTYNWVRVVDAPSPPAAWLALELGAGELAAMALVLQDSAIVLLDDQLARNTAQEAAIQVWGTLRTLLEAKHQGHIMEITPYMTLLHEAGLWMSQKIRQRILKLADE